MRQQGLSRSLVSMREILCSIARASQRRNWFTKLFWTKRKAKPLVTAWMLRAGRSSGASTTRRSVVANTLNHSENTFSPICKKQDSYDN